MGDDNVANELSPELNAFVNTISTIAAGYYHTLAVLRNFFFLQIFALIDMLETNLFYFILEDGQGAAWGYNAYGELGDGSSQSVAYPVAITNFPSNVIQVAAGQYHSLALTCN